MHTAQAPYYGRGSVQRPHLTSRYEQCEASGSQVLPTEVRTRASGHVPKTVRTPRRRQMLMVRRRRQDGGPDAGASLPPLQPMERPAENALERGGERNWMESGQFPPKRAEE
jgi:hypothetical protein